MQIGDLKNSSTFINLENDKVMLVNIGNHLIEIEGFSWGVNLETGELVLVSNSLRLRSDSNGRHHATDEFKPGYNADGSKGLLAIDAIRRGEKFAGGRVMTASQK